MERVAAVAAFGDQLPSATPEAVNTLNDRIGHDGAE
jgi:hypothetical protein